MVHAVTYGYLGVSYMGMKKTIKRMLLSILLICVAGVAALFFFIRTPRFGQAPTGDRLERIKNSPNYRNGSFQNLEPTPDLAEDANMATVMWNFIFARIPRQIPADSIPHIATDLRALDRHSDALVWFGHSSYLLQTNGKRFLIDPVFNGNASPVSFTTKSFLGTTNYHATDMPTIDVLVLTHDHWDHLDYHTVKQLEPNVTQVICPLGVGAHLEHWGYPPAKITELDWYEAAALPDGFTIHATPARHFSGRGFKRNGTLWASYALQTPSRRIFLGGDSGYGTHFAEIGKNYGPFDLAILENGQYNTAWIYIHMLPEQVLQAAQDLRADQLLPVHHSKFPLALHSWDEPLIRITEANKKAGIPLWTPQIGQVVPLADSAQVFGHWWEGVK